MNFLFRNESFFIGIWIHNNFPLDRFWQMDPKLKWENVLLLLFVVVCHFTFVLRCWLEFMTFRFVSIFALIWWNYPPSKINILTMTNWSEHDDINWQWLSKYEINGIRFKFKWMMQQIWDTASDHHIPTFPIHPVWNLSQALLLRI